MTQKRIEIINNNNNNNIETNNNTNINNNENISPETNEEITFNSNSVSNSASIPSNSDSNSNNLILNLNNSDIIQLYIGLQVDILDSVNYWTEAEIIKIDLENKKIFITYLYWSSRWDEWIDINSGRVAPLHTHTYNPPNPLQLRQRIEVLRYSEWREAFVVEQSLTQVKVHYRNIPFQYDEWIDRNSQRIRKFGHSKTIKKNKKWSVPVISNSSNNKINNNDENYDYNSNNNANNNNNNNNNRNNNHNNHNDNNLHTRQIIQSSDRYNHYIQGLQRFKLEVYGVSGDGNCLFRSVSHQIYGDDSFHLLVREKCMDYMEVNSSFFSQFVIGGMDSFPTYLRVKRMNGCWGDDPEIQAMCEIYDQSAQIWAYDSNSGARCLRTFHEITSSRPTTAASVSSASTSLATTTNTLSHPTTPNNNNTNNTNNANNSTTSNTNTPWWRMGNSSNNSNNNSITQKNPIRLSYYGGGHYDSLIYSRNNSNNNNQTSERRVYPRPGEIEDRAISRAKERVRLGLNSHLHTEEAKQSTDIDATEMAELELALEVSRNNLTEWEDDIDACLLLSTQETSLNGLEEFKDSSDLPPQLIETQQQMFQTVVEQSEREYIEKALEESIKTATSQNLHQVNSNNNNNNGNINNNNINNDDVDLDITEAELMESVYQESLKVSPTSTTTTSLPNSLPSAAISSNFTTSIDPDVKLALELSELNEDELLQRALQESLNNNNNTTTTTNNNNNNQQYQPQQPRLNTNTNNLSEEEQLQEAIRMSMMNQFQSNELYSHNMIPDDVDPELEMAIQASYHDFHR